jgi:hypothetical protein
MVIARARAITQCGLSPLTGIGYVISSFQSSPAEMRNEPAETQCTKHAGPNRREIGRREPCMLTGHIPSSNADAVEPVLSYVCHEIALCPDVSR